MASGMHALASASSDGPTTPPESLIGAILGERYRVEALLGEGGMGAVYRAEHVHMRKAVALKVLHKEVSHFEQIATRFEREAIAGARIEHSNVAKTMDFGRFSDGTCYLVLEYVPGKSLAALLCDGPLPPLRALGIVFQIVAGVTAAHAAGVVHRDLKPDNVMLTEREGGEELVKILDFGVAKLHAEPGNDDLQLTQTGMLIGTPEYMAPEQAGGGRVDARADLYAIGVMLYEMLAGHAPFRSEDRALVLVQQLTEPPPPLPAFVPREVAALVAELLVKDPDARLASAQELGRRMEALLSGPLPPVPKPDGHAIPPATASAVAGEPPPGRRRTVLMTVGVLVVLAGVALLGVFVFASSRSDGAGDALAATAAEQPGSAGVSEPSAAQSETVPLPASAPAAPVAPDDAAAAEYPARSAMTPDAAAAAAKPGSERKAKHAEPKKSRPQANATKKKTGILGTGIPPPKDWF